MAPTFAGAATGGYFLAAGLEYTNNVELAPTNEKSELISVASGGINYEERSRHFDFRTVASGEYQHYQDGTYDDELLAIGSVDLRWKPYPDQLHWIVRDVFSPTVDPQDKVTPNNIENTNYFETGPDVFFRFGPVNTLNIGGRVGDSRTQTEANIDNTFVTGYGRWLYRATVNTELSLNHDRQKVYYKDDQANQDFRENTSYVGYSYRGTQNRVGINYGYSVVNREDEDPVRANVGDFEWNRNITLRSTFVLRASQNLSDASTDTVSQVENNPNQGITETARSTDVFLSRRAVARYNWGGSAIVGPGGGASNGIEVFWAKKKYEIDTDNDEEDEGGRVSFIQPFSATFYGTAAAYYVKKDFFSIGRIDRESSGQLGLNYQATRRITLGTWVRYTDVNSSDPAFSYEETRIAVFIAYSTLASGQL